MKKIKLLILICIITISTVILFGCNKTRYTVTKEQWESYSEAINYTVEYYYKSEDNESYSLQKVTEDALYVDGTLCIFIDGKEYRLEEEENGWIAYEQDLFGNEIYGILEGVFYEDYTYDKDKKAYVSKIYEDNSWGEIMFENGVLVKVSEYWSDENNNIIKYYTLTLSNIGTTTIEIPEYTFYDPSVTRRTITEEEWNNIANTINYSLMYSLIEDDTVYFQQSNNNNHIINDEYYVEMDGEFYKLEQRDNGYVGVLVNEFKGFSGSLLKGLSFDDVLYNEEQQQYITKNVDDNGLQYKFKFYDGKISLITIIDTLSDNEEGQMYLVSKVGGVVVDVPEYTIEEQNN